MSFAQSGALALWVGMIAGCGLRPAPADPPLPPPPAAHPANPATTSAPALGPVGFVPIPIGRGASFRRLVGDLGPDRLTLLLKLNRIDLRHARTGDTLALPADTTLGELDLAPLPTRLPALDSVPKLIVVAQRVQAFAAYEWGHLVYWGPTSRGKRATPTPNGLFHTNWKARKTRSTENPAWILPWYFNIENERGVSLHQYDLPGIPASHACIRLLGPDAEWLYRWADQWRVEQGTIVAGSGTPVIIFGAYRFDARPPWRGLVTGPDAAAVGPAELDSVVARHRRHLGEPGGNR